MQCGSCGTQNLDDASFCTNCGNQFKMKGGKGKNQMHQTAQPKKLYRARQDRIVAGVCGGIGQYMDVDSTLIRILFVLFTVFGGSGLLLYLILVVVIPESPLDPWKENKPNV